MDMDRAIGISDEVAFRNRLAREVALEDSSNTGGNEKAANDHDKDSRRLWSRARTPRNWMPPVNDAFRRSDMG
jgi:hypothetical protein